MLLFSFECMYESRQLLLENVSAFSTSIPTWFLSIHTIFYERWRYTFGHTICIKFIGNLGLCQASVHPFYSGNSNRDRLGEFKLVKASYMCHEGLRSAVLSQSDLHRLLTRATRPTTDCLGDVLIGPYPPRVSLFKQLGQFSRGPLGRRPLEPLHLQ